MTDTQLDIRLNSDTEVRENPFKSTPEEYARRRAKADETLKLCALVAWIEAIRKTAPATNEQPDSRPAHTNPLKATAQTATLRRIGETRQMDALWLAAERRANPLPDPALDPSGWWYRVRARMHAYAIRGGLRSDGRRTALIGDVLDRAAGLGWLGDEKRCWTLFRWELRHVIRRNRDYEQATNRRIAEQRRLQTLGFDLKLPSGTVNQLIRERITQRNDPDYAGVEQELRAMATEQTAEKRPEPQPEPQSVLDAAFPRDGSGKSVDAPALPWGDDNHLRGVFFARYRAEVWEPRACPQDQAEHIRKGVLVREYGVDTLRGFSSDVEELLGKLSQAVEAEYPLAMAYFEGQAEKTSLTNEQSRAVSQGSTDVSKPTKIEQSSGAENGTSDAADKVREIREKYTGKISGREYLTVQGRVALFRLKYPSGTIATEHITITEEFAIFKATVAVDGVILSTGYGRASLAATKNLGGRYIEKSETAAVGRALALAGFGTDDSLDDSDYLSDSPIAKVA